jgi:glyoxylase-like metal-dependent hydrolase (beta-lactamase superfamily II)
MKSGIEIRSFYHQPTFTWSHLLWDTGSGRAAVIDPVLDYDAPSGRTRTASAAEILGVIEDGSLRLDWILETHAHADHLSAADWLREKTGAKVAIGAGIRSVQENFKAIYNLGPDFVPDGSQFDRLLEDEDRLPLGESEIRVLRTPGHTSDSVTYVVDGAAFIGDTLFTPEYGTARCDFPGGDARMLYQTIQRIYSLGDGVRLYLCHDYPPKGVAPKPMVTVAEQRAGNVHAGDGISEDEFVALRHKRDATLDVPVLILPSVQVNIRGGKFPPHEDNGVSYLKIPIDRI